MPHSAKGSILSISYPILMTKLMGRVLKYRKTHQIRLGHCMLICMAGLLSSVGGLFWWGAYNQLDTSFNAFDVRFYENELQRVSGVLKQNQLAFESLLKDYAH